LHNPDTTIVAYQNVLPWPDAVLLAASAKRLDALPRAPGCSTPGLLCASFLDVDFLRVTAGTQETWDGTDLHVRFLPKTPAPRVLMVSQLYRPGWEAELSDGKTVKGYRLFGGLTGFDLPGGVSSARITFT